MNTDIHASSVIRTHDPRLRTGEVGSCLRLRGHCVMFMGKSHDATCSLESLITNIKILFTAEEYVININTETFRNS
jgi:hypothetical protein